MTRTNSFFLSYKIIRVTVAVAGTTSKQKQQQGTVAVAIIAAGTYLRKSVYVDIHVCKRFTTKLCCIKGEIKP